MGFFSNNYKNIRFPLAEDENPGLRRAQIGAISAINAHFTLKNETAVITMPTGSGKTAVLMLSAFTQRANRVLVITPSRLVRSQIKEQFTHLGVLKNNGILVYVEGTIKVAEVDGYIKEVKEWEDLKAVDVVVATPNSVSPGISDVAAPPNDLFDLVLVDESHHSPARTWQALLKAFPDAKKILFTATPFRRDKREIKGQFIYTYPLKEAFDDQIFGKINYEPVEVSPGESNDVAISKKTEQIFRRDKSNGLHHFVMVRTDRKKRADELAEIYKDNTKLNLRIIHSRHTYSYIKQTINKLKRGELDGVICVNMLGEGFDFPNLKIAAIHTPHRSLEITLQFIGRFARTSSSTPIGEATFLAVPSEIEIETEKLFIEGAVWQEKIQNLSQTRITSEINTREKLQTFEAPSDSTIDTEDLSLYSLVPFQHVRIYNVSGPVNLEKNIPFPSSVEVVYRSFSSELSTLVIITKNFKPAKWTMLDSFSSVAYNLIIIHFNEEHNFLFINAAQKNDKLYDLLTGELCTGSYRLLPHELVDRVISDLKESRFYNVGMRKSQDSINAESYRIIAGPFADKAIKESDGRLYHKGHVFGSGVSSDGKSSTIGYSSSSKVWSNGYTQIPKLIDWCELLADKIVHNTSGTTGSGLDFLATPVTITKLPEDIIGVRWHDNAYKSFGMIEYKDSQGKKVKCQQLDLDLEVDVTSNKTGCVKVFIRGEDLEYTVDFSLTKDKMFSSSDTRDDVQFIYGNHVYSLLEYLNFRPLQFFTANFSRLIDGNQLLIKNSNNILPFDIRLIEAIDWESENVDINSELDPVPDGKISIHTFLKNQLAQTDHDFAIYDHGSGEVADFITIKSGPKSIQFELYHCKGTKGEKPGERVEDFYEVCGQVVKSMKLTESNTDLLRKIKYRMSSNSNFTFLRGSSTQFEQLFTDAKQKVSLFKITIVQPGISATKLTDKTLNLLAASNDYLLQRECDPLRVLASA